MARNHDDVVRTCPDVLARRGETADHLESTDASLPRNMWTAADHVITMGQGATPCGAPCVEPCATAWSQCVRALWLHIEERYKGSAGRE
jgi:hypothetical protein